MNLDDITPLVLTHDEAPNIRRSLDALTWARRVLVVDSGSTDGTLEIAARYPNVDVVQRPFDTFAGQCNFGLDRVGTAWVLSLDADYVVDSNVVEEVRSLAPAPDIAGYDVRFRYCVRGVPLRASLYPPRTVLYRRDRGRYADDGHGHRVRVAGRVDSLRHPVLHDDRKPLDRWLASQRRYASREAEKLLDADPATLGRADRVRRLRLGAVAMPFYCLFARGLILDGAPGWRYTMERTYAELLLALELDERAARRGGQGLRAAPE